jgi:hypothetical protein
MLAEPLHRPQEERRKACLPAFLLHVPPPGANRRTPQTVEVLVRSPRLRIAMINM